jgi:hypothetical protein
VSHNACLTLLDALSMCAWHSASSRVVTLCLGVTLNRFNGRGVRHLCLWWGCLFPMFNVHTLADEWSHLPVGTTHVQRPSQTRSWYQIAGTCGSNSSTTTRTRQTRSSGTRLLTCRTSWFVHPNYCALSLSLQSRYFVSFLDLWRGTGGSNMGLGGGFAGACHIAVQYADDVWEQVQSKHGRNLGGPGPQWTRCRPRFEPPGMRLLSCFFCPRGVACCC